MRPRKKWQTQRGTWMFPCSGGCGAVTPRPSVTKMKSWTCDDCLIRQGEMMPKHPGKGSRAAMSATAGRTGRKYAPGQDSPASVKESGPNRRTKSARSAKFPSKFGAVKKALGAH